MPDSPRRPQDPIGTRKMFQASDFAALLDAVALRSLPAPARQEAQDRNMATLISIQRAAAIRYQTHFENQIAAFERSLNAAEAASPGDEEPGTNADTLKNAYEEALHAASTLAEAAQQANRDALEAIQAQIKATITELSKPEE